MNTGASMVVGAPPTPDRSLAHGSEDQKFFAFARENILVLLALGSVPALSHLLNIIPAPLSGNLSLIASMLCLVVFWSALSLKGPIRDCLIEDGPRHTGRSWLRGRWWLPFAFVVGTLFVGSWLIACYLDAHQSLLAAQASKSETVTRASALHIWTYLAIYPLLIAGIAVLIVMRFCLIDAADAQDIIREKLPSKAPEIVALLSSYAEFIRLSQRQNGSHQEPPLRKIGEELLKDARTFIQDLSEARIEVTKSQAIRVQMLLLANFPRAFCAVSDRDIGFWHDPDEMAKDYLKLNIDAINRGTPVSRIFILAADDFFFQEGPQRGEINVAYLLQTVDVLVSHQSHQMGWAIAIHDQLDIELRDRHHRTLDFGLFHGEHGQASSYFRDHREPIRKLSVVFDVGEENSREIAVNCNTFRELIRHAWAFNTTFFENVKASSLFATGPNDSTANMNSPFVDVANTSHFRDSGYKIISFDARRSDASGATATEGRHFPVFFSPTNDSSQAPLEIRLGSLLHQLAMILKELRHPELKWTAKKATDAFAGQPESTEQQRASGNS